MGVVGKDNCFELVDGQYSQQSHTAPYKKRLQFWNSSKSAVTAVDWGILDAVIAEKLQHTAVILHSNCSYIAVYYSYTTLWPQSFSYGALQAL